MNSISPIFLTNNDIVILRGDLQYDIGGKVMTLHQIQQAVIDAEMYHEQLRIIRGELK